jgi:DNA-binding response OmpR family regulator
MAKILIVDDDPLLVRMYQQKLENDGFAVDTADDGEVAFKKASEGAPDLILLDVMMPKVNGFQVLTNLKANKNTSTIPVVMLTNVGGSEEDINRGLELGAVAYLIKASNRPSAVVSKIKEILGGYVRELPRVKVAIGIGDGTKHANDKKNALAEIEDANKAVIEAQKKVEEAKSKLTKAS